jgi:hypothetical protein
MLYENALRHSCFTRALLVLYSCFTRALLVLYFVLHSCFIAQYSCGTLLSCCGRQRGGFAWQLAHTQALLRLYSGFTQALLRLCGRQREGFAWQLAHTVGFTQALLRLYSGFISFTQALLRLYLGFTQALLCFALRCFGREWRNRLATGAKSTRPSTSLTTASKTVY